MKNNKFIKAGGKGWTLLAVALECPSRDVAVEISLPTKKIVHLEIPDEVKHIKEIVTNWFEDSTIMSHEHFIFNVSEKSAYRFQGGKKHNLKMKIDVSCCTRQNIEMGTTSFEKVFGSEIKRLVGELSLG